jgi:hypothetical protein
MIPGRVVPPRKISATTMKMLFLCLLMMSIVAASFYGPATPALRRLINR